MLFRSLLQTLSDADDESYSLACEALAEFDRRPDLDRVAVPFLLGPGEHDGVVPPARAQQDADAIAGSRLRVFAGCGHLPPAESPGAVAQALTELLPPPRLEPEIARLRARRRVIASRYSRPAR